MIKCNKWGYGLVISLALGLSGCFMDDDRSDLPRDYYSSPSAANMGTDTSSADAKPQQKSYASKDPAQKSTPGPKRAAAPQIPVIQ